MSYHAYVNHPDFDAYLVAIATKNFTVYGRPEELDWSAMDGMIWVAHNVTFDKMVFDKLTELYPEITARPHTWVNTADLAVYMQGPRSLAGATEQFMGITMDKTARSDMDGRQWSDLNEAEKNTMRAYCRKDAKLALQFWNEFEHLWPHHERELSMHTTTITERGVAIDLVKLSRWMKKLKKLVWKLEADIPWAGEAELTPTGKVRMKGGKPKIKSITSSSELAVYARGKGIPLPASTDVKSQEFQEWADEWGEKFPLIATIQHLRKAVRLLRLLEAIEDRVRPDGRMEHELLYFGAHTGRWSGKRSYATDDDAKLKGVNMLNMLKAPVELEGETMDFRSLFIAGPGKKFVIADLAQIEPRCMAKMCNDTASLALMAKGMSPYEVHARTTMGWTGGKLKDENPQMYAFAKARVLALGYGAGWAKFIMMAAMYISKKDFVDIFSAPVTDNQIETFRSYLGWVRGGKPQLKAFDDFDDEKQRIWVNAKLMVDEFRKTNPMIADKSEGLWGLAEIEFKQMNGDNMTVKLFSGRTYKYFDVNTGEGKATVTLPNRRENLYGGKFVENQCQAEARDAFADRLLALEKAGHNCLWHIYDEYVLEVDENVSAAEIREIIMTSPEWAADLPLDVDIIESQHYCK